MRLKYLSVISGCTLLFVALAVRADVSSSAHYLVTNGSFDGGGERTYSAAYVQDLSVSFGSLALASSANYVQRGGYIGGLNNAPVVLPQTFTRSTNAALNILLSRLTGTNGVVDSEGDTVSLFNFSTNTPYSAGLKQMGNVFLVYSPEGYTGSDLVGWTALDSEGDTSPGTINVMVPIPTNSPTLNLISATSAGGGGYTLLFAGLPPAVNTQPVTVQYTASLTPPVTWSTLPGIFIVTNGVLTVTDSTDSGSRFYRTLY